MTDAQRTAEGLVHRVCQFFRDEMATYMDCSNLQCHKCPMSEPTPYGPGVRACVTRAKELIELVRSGS